MLCVYKHGASDCKLQYPPCRQSSLSRERCHSTRRQYPWVWHCNFLAQAVHSLTLRLSLTACFMSQKEEMVAQKKRERDAEIPRWIGGRCRSNERGERRIIYHFFQQQAAQTENTSAQILGRCQKSFPRPERIQVAGKTLSTEHQARWPLTKRYPDKQPQVRRRWPASNTSVLHSQRHMLPGTLVKVHKS